MTAMGLVKLMLLLPFTPSAAPLQGQLQKLHNEMLMLKAKTMFEMVEEVEVGNSTAPLRLLYLSNTQADSIASSPNALQKMLEALEIRPPKLVINLLSSWGLRASLMLYPERFYNQNVETAGLLFNDPSFLSAEEEQKTTAQLDMFMSDVILPLAATTNALIIANAITGDLRFSTFIVEGVQCATCQVGWKSAFHHSVDFALYSNPLLQHREYVLARDPTKIESLATVQSSD